MPSRSTASTRARVMLAALLSTTPAMAAEWARVVLAQDEARRAVAVDGSVRIALDLTLQCPATATARALFVSVADTRRVEMLPARAATADWSIDVPLEQLEWLTPVNRACASAAAQREPDEVEGAIHWYRLRAATQAYASLECVGVPPARAAHDASIPVAVWLSCPATP